MVRSAATRATTKSVDFVLSTVWAKTSGFLGLHTISAYSALFSRGSLCRVATQLARYKRRPQIVEPTGGAHEIMRAVMIPFFRQKKSRSQIVEEAFKKYMDACREFWRVSERRAMSVQQGDMEIPLDRTPVWQDMFGIQRLFIERQALRFEYLLRGGVSNLDTWTSLNSITERLDQEWGEKEETDLKESSAIYNDVSREIRERQSRLNSSAIRGPGETLQQDAKYQTARFALAKKIEKLDKELSA